MTRSEDYEPQRIHRRRRRARMVPPSFRSAELRRTGRGAGLGDDEPLARAKRITRCEQKPEAALVLYAAP